MKYWYYISYVYNLPSEIISDHVTRSTTAIESGEIWRSFPIDTYEKIQKECKAAVLLVRPNAQNLVILGCSLMRIEE